MKDKYLKIQKKLKELESHGIRYPKSKNIKEYLLLIKKEFNKKFCNMDNYFVYVIGELQSRIDAAKALKNTEEA